MRRTALLAVLTPFLLLPSAASAQCIAAVCVPDAQSLLVAAVDAVASGGGGGGDGSGVLCLYVKTTPGPPHGWNGDPESQPPYVFFETQKWGMEHPDDHDKQFCAPACRTDLPDDVACQAPTSRRGG